uniref:Leucine-rich repeat-containing protein 70-like n=2 Tax=Petromyzon marinus TaxID=7757 RepID=A0AAJ7T1K1_PETMA|nr:leucine-rich repeat-containing protein 70-like [Petromyzon marinus]
MTASSSFLLLLRPLILMVLFATLRGAAAQPCPAPCHRCRGGLVSCQDAGLVTFPRHLPRSTTALQLSGNRLLRRVLPSDVRALSRLSALLLDNCGLSRLRSEAFSSLGGLRRLSLGGNGLRRLEVGAFGGLANLQDLRLHDNLIDVLPRNVFLELTSLRRLQLQNNLLQGVRDGLFAGVRRMSTLSLDDNDIASVSHAAFAMRSELRSLSLANNNLTQIPSSALARLKNLDRLVVSGNRISRIHPFAFRGLAKLVHLILDDMQLLAIAENGFAGLGNTERLYLRRNHLKALSADVLRPLVKLEELHLDGNSLTALADDLLAGPSASLRVLVLASNRLSRVSPEPFVSSASLARLQLGGNPLLCDCGALPLWLWMATAAAAVAHVDVRCQFPERLRGQRLDRVPRESLGHCHVRGSHTSEGEEEEAVEEEEVVEEVEEELVEEARSQSPASPLLHASVAPRLRSRNVSALARKHPRGRVEGRRVPTSYASKRSSDGAASGLSAATGSQAEPGGRSPRPGPPCDGRAAEADAAFNAVLGLLIVSLCVSAASGVAASRLWRRLRTRDGDGGGIVESSRCSTRSLPPRYRPSCGPSEPTARPRSPPAPPAMPISTVELDRALLLRLCEEDGPQVVLFEHTVL